MISAASSANAYLAQLRLQSATPSTTAASAAGTSTQSATQLLKSANDSIFKMADLTKRVRSLSNLAANLREGDANGLDVVRKQMSAMLGEFNTIAGTKAEASTDTPLSRSQVQAQLRDMQSNLRANITKVGNSSIVAVASGATTTKSQAMDSNDAWSNWVASLRAAQQTRFGS